MPFSTRFLSGLVFAGLLHMGTVLRIYGTNAAILLMLGTLVILAHQIRLGQMWFQH